MKRSEMLKLLEKAITSRDTGHYFYSSMDHAEFVLSTIEQAEMLPPSKWGCYEYLSECPHDHKWDPEAKDEKFHSNF